MKKFWLLVGISLLFKLILSALMPLGADEAYYWVWSHRLQLSYFDHPPMVAWLFYLGHFLEPFMNAVRWPAIIMGHGIILIWYWALKDKLDWQKWNLWLYLVLFSPLLGFGSLIITPDLPVLFFWTLSIAFVIKALEKKSLHYYAWLGAALGLGFCSKYHIVIFVPCLLAYLSLEKKWKEVRAAGILLTLLIGLLFCTPVILWNIQNDFASFEFQLKHGLESFGYNYEWTTSYILGQILILFPLIFWALLKARVPTSLRWTFYFGWGPLAFFFLTSFRAWVEANWPIIGYPSLLTIALFYPKTQNWLKYYLAIFGAATLIVVSSLWIPASRNFDEKLREPYQFLQLSELAHEYQPLYGGYYQMAASLWYFSKVPTFKLKDMSRFDFFDTLPEAMPEGNKFYLLKKETNGLPVWLSQQQWQGKEIKRFPPDFVLLEFTRP